MFTVLNHILCLYFVYPFITYCGYALFHYFYLLVFLLALQMTDLSTSLYICL